MSTEDFCATIVIFPKRSLLDFKVMTLVCVQQMFVLCKDKKLQVSFSRLGQRNQFGIVSFQSFLNEIIHRSQLFSLAASISSAKDCGISIPAEIPTSGLSPSRSLNPSISTIKTEMTSRSSFLIFGSDISLCFLFVDCNLNVCENRFSIQLCRKHSPPTFKLR